MTKFKFQLILIALVMSSFACNSVKNKNSESLGLTDKFIEDTILSLKEVQEKNKLIDSISNHKKGISIIIDKPGDQEPDYHIQVGFNGEENFETYYHFYIDTASKQIKIDDFALGKKIPVDEWRNQNIDSIYTELGMDLLKSEKLGELKIDLKEDSIIALLGNPEEVSKAIKWETDGLFHQTWTYKKNGIELDVCWEKIYNKTIFSISISGLCNLKTKREIGIGSTREQVINTYKIEIDPRLDNENSIIAGSIYGGMIFEIENNVVKSIFIGSAAE